MDFLTMAKEQVVFVQFLYNYRKMKSIVICTIEILYTLSLSYHLFYKLLFN